MTDATSMQPRPGPRRLATFEQTGRHRGVSERTVRNWLGRGHFRGYKVPGIRAVLLDLDEVDAALTKLPASKVRSGSGFGFYGPNAVIVDLPPQAIITDDRLPR
jgi:excisionase family DNA binding protein